jgi:exodeoxyribonuclease VII small subunit
MDSEMPDSTNGSESESGDSFESALEQLHDIVERLEGDELSLEQTIALFNRGSALADRCLHLIDAAELSITVVNVDPGATAETR